MIWPFRRTEKPGETKPKKVSKLRQTAKFLLCILLVDYWIFNPIRSIAERKGPLVRITHGDPKPSRRRKKMDSQQQQQQEQASNTSAVVVVVGLIIAGLCAVAWFAYQMYKKADDAPANKPKPKPADKPSPKDGTTSAPSAGASGEKDPAKP